MYYCWHRLRKMSFRASAVSINFGLSDTLFGIKRHRTGIAIAPTATPMTDVGAWVCLGDQVGQITKLDTGGKCAVAIVNGPTKWRTVKDVSPIFGTSGVPKAMLTPGDWVRLTDKKAGELVGQLIKIEGGRFNVKLMDGKTLWRGLADLTPPFDDAPALPILGTAQPAKEASESRLPHQSRPPHHQRRHRRSRRRRRSRHPHRRLRKRRPPRHRGSSGPRCGRRPA